MFQTLTTYLKTQLNRLTREQEGQTMVEYVMLIVLVALAVFLATPNIKSAILKVFQNTSSALS
jgi:Flp pilus assembly pilin Flp